MKTLYVYPDIKLKGFENVLSIMESKFGTQCQMARKFDQKPLLNLSLRVLFVVLLTIFDNYYSLPNSCNRWSHTPH